MKVSEEEKREKISSFKFTNDNNNNKLIIR